MRIMTEQWENKMKHQNKSRFCRQGKRLLYILCFIAVLSGIIQNTKVFAAGTTATTGSITVICPVDGMKVSLYRVADYEETGVFTRKGSFKDYSVSLEQESAEGWQGVANILADYARRDAVEPDACILADTEKTVCFTDLLRGLYLVTATVEEKSEDGKTMVYEPQVSLIALPDASMGTDPYQVTAVLKYKKTEQSETSGTSGQSDTKLHVLKVWQKDQEKDRPASIQVDLLRTDRNGKTTVADRKILNQENNWSYTWRYLSQQAQWSVTETEIPTGYTVSSRWEGDTMILTNTAINQVKSEEVQNSNKMKLPQTGQLWWPVPLLLLAGVFCLFIGRKLCYTDLEKKRHE